RLRAEEDGADRHDPPRDHHRAAPLAAVGKQRVLRQSAVLEDQRRAGSGPAEADRPVAPVVVCVNAEVTWREKGYFYHRGHRVTRKACWVWRSGRSSPQPVTPRSEFLIRRAGMR